MTETGKSARFPELSVHPDSRATDSDIMSAFLKSIRHSYSVLGYTNELPGFIEPHLGVMFPGNLTTLLEKFGFNITAESTSVIDFFGDEVNSACQFGAVGGRVYSDKHHKPFSSQTEHLNALSEHIERNGGIIMF